MNKPMTYIDRINKINPRYCFISYAHKDSERVYAILDKLFNNGVNYWYDKELNPGDKWDDKVEEHIVNENCQGAFLFLSESSLNSEAVAKELEIVTNIRETNPGFFVIPVLIGFADLDEIIIYLTVNKKKEVRNYIFQLTDDDAILYIKDENFENELPRVMKKLNVSKVTENTDVIVTEEKIQYLDEIFIEKGVIYFKKGEYYISSEDRKDEIVWKLVAQEAGKMYFVSKYAIDFIAYSDLDSKLKEIKKLVMDTEYIDDCLFLSMDLINKYNSSIGRTYPTDYADIKREQQMRLYWASENEGFVLYNSENKQVSMFNNLETLPINAGIRLVLVVDDSKIKDDRIK